MHVLIRTRAHVHTYIFFDNIISAITVIVRSSLLAFDRFSLCSTLAASHFINARPGRYLPKIPAFFANRANLTMKSAIFREAIPPSIYAT